MSVVGSIAVNIVARTSAFMKGIGATRKNLRSFEKSVEATQGRLGSLNATLAGIGTAIVGGTVVTTLKDTAERLDAVAKTADRIGMSTEALAGLQHGAGLAGVDVGLLDQSLQGMVKRVSEAANGTGKAVGAIEDLRLSAQTLSRQSPDKMLAMIADGLEGVSSQSDKVRIATKLFGDQGASLLNFLAEGSGAIAKYRAEAERLGLAISRDDIAKVEEMNDALSRLGAVWEGTKRELVVTIAPASLDGINALREAFEGFRLINKDKGVSRGIGKMLQSAGGSIVPGASVAPGFFGKAQNAITRGMTRAWAGPSTMGAEAGQVPGFAGEIRKRFRMPFTAEEADRILGAANQHENVRAETRARAMAGFRSWIAKGNDTSWFGRQFSRVSDMAEKVLRADAPGSLGQALGQNGIFGRLNSLTEQAKQFGLQHQRKWMFSQMFGGGSVPAMGAKGIMPLGGNEIAERGTQAAYQASKASDQVGKILREQLAVAKQQVEHLATIASAANGGDTFSMGAA